MQLYSGIEDELVRRLTSIGDCTGHVVSRTVDDVVAVDRLTLEECGIESARWIYFVESGEEGVLETMSVDPLISRT